jgi:DMSO reductase anchor subunit
VTLQLKNILMLLLTFFVGLFSGWVISAIYANAKVLWIVMLAILLIACVAGQVLLTIFVKSKEEEEFELLNELRVSKTRQRIAEAEAMSKKIEEEIKAGNLQSAQEWNKIRDNL